MLTTARRILATSIVLLSGAGAVLAASPTISSAAVDCYVPKHCYAIAQTTAGLTGAKTVITTQGSDVYNWTGNYGLDHYTNEIWLTFPAPAKGWLEIGQYAGADWTHQQTPSCCALHYFFAHDLTNNSNNIVEVDAPNGPAIDQAQEYGVQWTGVTGTYCVLLNGFNDACYGEYGSSFPAHSEVGLEAVYQAGESLYNYGIAQNNLYQASDGSWHSWGKPAYIATPGSKFCAYPPAGYSEGSLAFGSGGCENNSIVLAGPLMAPLVSKPEGDAFANYVPAVGPALSDEAQRSIGVDVASGAEDGAPTSLVSVHSTLDVAAQAIDPSLASMDEGSPGFKQWLESEVFVLTMRGQFKLVDAKVPVDNNTVPTGTFLSVVIDAKTGWVDMVHLSDSISPTIADLGHQTVLR